MFRFIWLSSFTGEELINCKKVKENKPTDTSEAKIKNYDKIFVYIIYLLIYQFIFLKIHSIICLIKFIKQISTKMIKKNTKLLSRHGTIDLCTWWLIML